MNYWQFKFKDIFWKDFKTLELGDTFTTTITDKEKNKLNNRIGNIVFWYPSKSNKDMTNGIHFVTEIISNVRENDEYVNNYSIEMKIIESYIDNPFILENNGFKHITNKTKKGNFFQFNRYLFTQDDKGSELYDLLKQNNKTLPKLESIVNKDYRKIEIIKERNINNGTMFNPFLDMNLIKYEVKHLNFIANLLNPNGSHYQGDKFLKTFVMSLIEYEKQDSNLYLSNIVNSKHNNIDVRVQTEKIITKDKERKGGRIDIWIENNEYIIAIEGKIEAKDSKGQLNKYDKYLKKQDKPYLLIYLTMFGEAPTNSSPNNLQLMSFSEGIKDFIDYSLEEKIPEKIYSTLKEYQSSLITYLYGLKSDWKYCLDIVNEITKSKNNYEKYQNIKDLYYRNTKKYKFTVVEDIANNFEYAKANIERLFFKDIVDNMLEDEIYLLNENSSLSLKDNNLSNAKDLLIIANARKQRNAFTDNELGSIEIIFSDNENSDSFEFSIRNDYKGTFLNYISDEINTIELLEIDCTRLEPANFLSNNISKLLDKKYRTKLIQSILEDYK